MKRYLSIVFLAWLVVLVTACERQPVDSITVNGQVYIAGVDFTVLDQPIQIDYQPVTNVIEFFWYGCPHCARFEPVLQKWKATSAPEGLRFIRVPAIWNDLMVEHASAYFMARKYDMLDQVHDLLFQRVMSMNYEKDIALHQKKLRDFFIQQGLTAEQYDSYKNSEEMTALLKSIMAVLRAAKVSSTPSFLVNGRYILNTGSFSGTDEMFTVINAFIEQESERYPTLM